MRTVPPFLAALLLGCTSGDPPHDASLPPPLAPGIRFYDPAIATATVRVHARLEGAAPRMRMIRFDACPTAAMDNREPVFEETVVVREGSLANVVVWTAEGGDGWQFPPPSDPVSMDATGTVLRPHVATLQVGQSLRILNRGGCQFHGHLVAGRNPEWRALLPPRSGEAILRFAVEEVGMKLKCDVHGWTGGRIAAFAHPFHGVTGPDGIVTLRVPPGRYSMAAWHEKLASTEPQAVTVSDGETRDLEFVFRMK